MPQENLTIYQKNKYKNVDSLISRATRLGIISLTALTGVTVGLNAANRTTSYVKGEETSLTWLFSVSLPRQSISNIGLNVPKPLLRTEISKIKLFEQARNKYLNWQKDLEFKGLSKETAIILGSATAADHAILKNMNPDDLAGMLKEKRGIKILSKKGVPYNHIKEVQNACRAIKNTILQIHTRIIELQKTQRYNVKEVNLLLEKAIRLLEIEKLYFDLNNPNNRLVKTRKNIKYQDLRLSFCE